MARFIFLLVLAFAAYVSAYPSPQDIIQSLPGRVKRTPGPNPDPEHLHHYEKTIRDRYGNVQYIHEDVVHPDPYDFGHGHHFGHHHDHYHGHHSHGGYGGHGLLGGLFGGLFH